MIWLRRTIALFLALCFITLFIPMLVIFRINDTIGNPDFYNDQLRRADIYNFIYDDAAPAALEEAEIDGATAPGGIDISWAGPYVIGIMKQALPPQWLQTQTEQVIKAVLPYTLGDTGGFNVNVALKDRVQAAASAIKETLHQEDFMTKLYGPAIGAVVDKLAASLKGLPLSLDKETLETMVRGVLPPEWVIGQADSAIDEMVPYFTGYKEHFTVRVNILERMDALENAVTDILKRPETYDYISREILLPAVKQNMQKVTQIPAGITLTDSEILSAVNQILPLEWYQAQVTNVVGQVFAYFKGAQPTLEVTIPLIDRKPVAAEVLGKLLEPKLESYVNSLPVCTLDQLTNLLLNPSLSSLPTCRPLGLSYADLKKLLGIDTGTIIAPFVNTAIPDQFVLTGADLGRTLGSQGEDPVGQARDWVQKGLTYTDQQLVASLGADSRKMDEIRNLIASGFNFNESDLRNWIKASAGSNADEQLRGFDDVRSEVGMARRWKMAAWIIPALILGAIGILGGRRWSSRLLWAAAVVAVTGTIAYAISGPLFSLVAQPRIREAFTHAASQADKLQALVASKGLTIAQNAIDSFVGGIKGQAIILIAVALILIALGTIWHLQGRKRDAAAGNQPGIRRE